MKTRAASRPTLDIRHWALVIALLAAPALHAAPKPTPTPADFDPAPAHRPALPLPFSAKIYSVDPEAKTFSTQNREKQIRVYTVTADTKITKKSAPATFEDLKPGEDIRGMATPKGDGKFDTASLAIGPVEPLKPLLTPPPSPTPAATSPKTAPKTSPKSSPKASSKSSASKSPKKSPTPTPTPPKDVVD